MRAREETKSETQNVMSNRTLSRRLHWDCQKCSQTLACPATAAHKSTRTYRGGHSAASTRASNRALLTLYGLAYVSTLVQACSQFSTAMGNARILTLSSSSSVSVLFFCALAAFSLSSLARAVAWSLQQQGVNLWARTYRRHGENAASFSPIGPVYAHMDEQRIERTLSVWPATRARWAPCLHSGETTSGLGDG